MRSLARDCALLLALVAVTSPLAAQARKPREPEMIPRPLVDAALSVFFGLSGQDMFHFTVGGAPAGWPRALAPRAPASIVGGGSGGPIRTLLVRYPRSTDALAAYESLLRGAGYRAADTARFQGQEGFRSSYVPPRATAWCGDSSRAVFVVPVDSTPTSRRILVEYVTSPTTLPNVCGPRDSTAPPPLGSLPDSPLQLPPLRAPLGATVSPQGMNSSGSSFDVLAAADTALSAIELLTHYSEELGRGGWTLVGSATTTNGTAIRALRARDTAGDEWQGALVVLTAGERRFIHVMMSKIGGW